MRHAEVHQVGHCLSMRVHCSADSKLEERKEMHQVGNCLEGLEGF